MAATLFTDFLMVVGVAITTALGLIVVAGVLILLRRMTRRA